MMTDDIIRSMKDQMVPSDDVVSACENISFGSFS